MPEPVLFVSSSGDVMGGAETCLVDVATHIESYGWKPLVAVPTRGALADTMLAAGIPVQIGDLGVLRSRRELRSPRLVLRLAAVVPAAARLAMVIRTLGVSVVHSNTSVVLAGALAARLTGKPHVWHVREVLRGPAWQVLRRIVLALSDRVVCISSAVADNVAPSGSLGRARVTIIPDGIDLVHFSSSSSISNGHAHRVGMVARITPLKGHSLFLTAASLVSARAPDTEFYLVGGCIPAYGPLRRRLVILKSDLGLDARAHFVEHLDRDEVRDLMASLDILVLPSVLPEGGGLVALEAMALGRAVVATRHGGPLDIITNGVNGMLVSPEYPTEMADAIVSLLEDSSLRRRLGAAARQRVEAEYGLSRHLERLAAVYEEVVSARG